MGRIFSNLFVDSELNIMRRGVAFLPGDIIFGAPLSI